MGAPALLLLLSAVQGWDFPQCRSGVSTTPTSKSCPEDKMSHPNAWQMELLLLHLLTSP